MSSKGCGAIALILAGALTAPQVSAAPTTYYVRPDGGSAAQCDGTVDAPYPGGGSHLPCAWNHPFQALPPLASPRIAGGDTVRIGAGSYRMGYGAPGAEACDQEGAFDCVMAAVPSGSDVAHRTRVLGEGWDSGCPSPPELWGAERPFFVVNLAGSSHVEIACLEVTDHSGCIEDHNQSGLPCNGCDVPCERDTPPFGDWASEGLYAADSADVRLADLAVHGLAHGGIHAGRLRDWTVERVRLVANGAVGWDGDLGGPSSNSGDLVFRDLEVGWNGCAETWPGQTVRLDTCWAQQAGGYGDGIGLADSAGHWVFDGAWVHHNTSDGVDLLYLVGSSAVEIRRLRAEGNAGNQLKTSGDALVENTVLVGNCAFFAGSPLFQGAGEGDNCRAFGGAYSMSLHRGDQVRVVSSTITGQGDCLMDLDCRDADCDGSESVVVRDSLFAGATDWRQPFERTCLYYADSGSLPVDPVDFEFNLVWQVKDDACPGAASVCGLDPRLADGALASFDAHLRAGSPAIDAGTSAGAPLTDFDGYLRSDPPDLGAYELQDLIFADGFETGDTSRW